jgi:hypothetical protein
LSVGKTILSSGHDYDNDKGGPAAKEFSRTIAAALRKMIEA